MRISTNWTKIIMCKRNSTRSNQEFSRSIFGSNSNIESVDLDLATAVSPNCPRQAAWRL